MIQEIIWEPKIDSISGDDGEFEIEFDFVAEYFLLQYKNDFYDGFETINDAKTFAYKLKSKYEL